MRSFSKYRLCSRRAKAGLSAEQLGERIGRSAAAVRSYERGERLPNARTVGKLADALDCAVDDFYDTAEEAA